MKRLASLILILSFAFSLISCSTKESYNKYFAESDAAIEVFKEAIELLDICIEGEITAEDCAEQLKVVGNKLADSENNVEKLAALDISVASIGISNACIREKAGTETIVGIKNAVKEKRDQLYNTLYDKN